MKEGNRNNEPSIRKTRVLIGANDLLLAGVQRLVIEQLRALDRSRFELHLVVLMQFPDRATFYDLVPDDVQVHRLSFRGLLDLREWKKLIGILREVKPDVVKTATFFSNTLLLILRPFFGYAAVAAEHNTVNRKPGWQRFVDRLLLPQAYTIIGDSKQVVDFVSSAEGISSKHFTVVYNGVDLQAVEKSKSEYLPARAQIRKEFGIPEDAQVAFTAARIVKQKNHTLMIEGFAKACARRDDLWLVIAGEGELRPGLMELAKEKGADDRILFLGERTDIHRFYAIADFFLLTSRHEGFCIVAMEALAFGMPVISTKVAGVVEYLKEGENGFFIESTADDLAKTIERVLSLTKEERERIKKSGEEIASVYSIERYGQEINRIISEAARR